MLPEHCEGLLVKIARIIADLMDTMSKYNPADDFIGNFPDGHGGFTKPNGHYNKIKDLQRALKSQIDKFNDKCSGRNRPGGGQFQQLSAMAPGLCRVPVVPSPGYVGPPFLTVDRDGFSDWLANVPDWGLWGGAIGIGGVVAAGAAAVGLVGTIGAGIGAVGSAIGRFIGGLGAGSGGLILAPQ